MYEPPGPHRRRPGHPSWPGRDAGHVTNGPQLSSVDDMGNNVLPQPPARLRNRLEPLAMIAVFDVAGPLVTYAMVRSAGLGTVPALLLSGVLPALGVLLKFARHRRVDAVGVLVLAGVAVGTILGLISGNERLILAEGSVPTAIFGFACLGSLWTRPTLIF